MQNILRVHFNICKHSYWCVLSCCDAAALLTPTHSPRPSHTQQLYGTQCSSSPLSAASWHLTHFMSHFLHFWMFPAFSSIVTAAAFSPAGGNSWPNCLLSDVKPTEGFHQLPSRAPFLCRATTRDFEISFISNLLWKRRNAHVTCAPPIRSFRIAL